MAAGNEDMLGATDGGLSSVTSSTAAGVECRRDDRTDSRFPSADNYPASTRSAQADDPAKEEHPYQDLQGARRRDRNAHGV